MKINSMFYKIECFKQYVDQDLNINSLQLIKDNTVVVSHSRLAETIENLLIFYDSLEITEDHED